MITLQKWTGREAHALRVAIRMSVRDFAAYLGVSDRAVSKWEAGGENTVPRPDSQAMLDTALERASAEAGGRFELLLGIGPAAGASQRYGTAAGSEAGYPRRIIHPIDRKAMVLIEAGYFPSGPNDQPLWLPAFYMDVYPTTNKDYAAFVRATGHDAPTHWPNRNFPDRLGNHPVVNVAHVDARHYAAWSKKALPSAVQWEKAARGPRGNVFPWGNQETPPKCNVRQTGIGSTTPVGRYHSGASHYDVYDMSGNVWEWCSTETDPSRFILKGSAFTSSLIMAAGAAMNDASETMSDDDTGFRCVSAIENIRELLDIL